jgi:N-acetylneuraminic acid mutarotase
MKTTFLLAVVLPALMGTATVAVAQTPAVAHNTWSMGAPMPVAVKYGMAAALCGKIYVIGGITNSDITSNNQVYDPATNTWSSAKPIPQATFAAAIATADDNWLTIAGGSVDGSTQTSATWSYNCKRDEWINRDPMPTPRQNMGAASEHGEIYVAGGYNANGMLNTVERFYFVGNTWEELAPMSVAKSDLAVTRMKTTIVAADGLTEAGETGDDESYSNPWQSLAADPTARSAVCSGSVKGELYLAGGWNGESSLNLTEAFNLKTNEWTTLASMPQPVAAATSVIYETVVDGVKNYTLYCFGGGDTTTPFQGNVYSYVQIYQP